MTLTQILTMVSKKAGIDRLPLKPIMSSGGSTRFAVSDLRRKDQADQQKADILPRM
ncbi:hypothetical protein [Thiocapsa sp.]|uniref:hypothetical protein n=1 Tax=Thiocapsa sp. TaxID=2024551 RepID=UPI003593FE2A